MFTDGDVGLELYVFVRDIFFFFKQKTAYDLSACLVGSLPIDFSALAPAFLAMPGHKGLYGPQGTGVLLGGELPDGTEAYLAANDSAYLRCAVFACKDKDAAAAVKKLIQTYIDDSINAKYNVDEVALLQNAKIHSMGNYVAVAVTSDTDNVNKVIDQYFA